MPQLLVADLNEESLARLRQRALRHAQPVETEARLIIEAEMEKEEMDEAERVAKIMAFREWSREFRKLTAGTFQTDSTELIREDRDSDHGRD